MKVQLFTLLVALVAYANLVYTPSAEDMAEPDPIDFISLRTQAASALQALQSSAQERVQERSQERRIAAQDTAAATF
jgi:hypothetical protein